jgi:pyridinium-3,5-bisthiocarboxylic acid mononucleotide nickel chelatase
MPKPSRIAVIDCQIAGVAGDMFLSALLDLGADADKVVSAIKSLENVSTGYKKIKVTLKQVMRKQFKATTIDVTAESGSKLDGKELVKIVEECAEKLNLSANAQQFASNVVRTLVYAEAKLHNINLDDAHLHEVGLVDTAAEIIGSAVALDDLGLFDSKIYATPVSVGGGLFKFSHGIVSSPAPATLAIFQSKKFPIKGGPIEKELATPTGAAILINLVDEVSCFYPAMTPLKTGYGTGTRDFAELPNVLRITVGEPVDYGLSKGEIAVLETNLDDVTGEILGHTIDVLLNEGAKDVSIISAVTKKSRPCQILKVLANKQDVERLSRVLMEETGTLGVRVCFCERHVIVRELLQVDVIVEDVRETAKVKVAKDSRGEIIRIKPEFEDAKRIAAKSKKSLREITDLIMVSAREALASKSDLHE